jgi:hypothetical protein
MLQRKQERVMARAYGGAGRRSRPSRLSEGYLEEEQVGGRGGAGYLDPPAWVTQMGTFYWYPYRSGWLC